MDALKAIVADIDASPALKVEIEALEAALKEINDQPTGRTEASPSQSPPAPLKGKGDGGKKSPGSSQQPGAGKQGRTDAPTSQPTGQAIVPGSRVSFIRNGAKLTGKVTYVRADGEVMQVDLDTPTIDGLPKVAVPTAGATVLTVPSLVPAPDKVSNNTSAPSTASPAIKNPAVSEANQLEIERIVFEYEGEIRLAESWAKTDQETAGKMKKAAGMKKAAALRQVMGNLTPKETAAKEKYEASNYLGKAVLVNGKNGTVQGVSFGRVKVKFTDGTTASFQPDDLVSKETPSGERQEDLRVGNERQDVKKSPETLIVPEPIKENSKNFNGSSKTKTPTDEQSLRALLESEGKAKVGDATFELQEGKNGWNVKHTQNGLSVTIAAVIPGGKNPKSSAIDLAINRAEFPQPAKPADRYSEVRAKYPENTILMFRSGDYLQAMENDAKVAAPILGVALTKRGETPMVGIPIHSHKNYLKRLHSEGKDVQIAWNGLDSEIEKFTPDTDSPALSEGDKQILDALEGLFSSPLPPSFDSPIPQDRFMKLMGAAQTMVAEGTNSPEALAQKLATLAEGKLRPFTQPIWFAMKAVGAKGAAEPAWESVYGKLDGTLKQEQIESDGNADTQPETDRSLPEAGQGVERGTSQPPMGAYPDGARDRPDNRELLPGDVRSPGESGDNGSLDGDAGRPDSATDEAQDGRGQADGERGDEPSANGANPDNAGAGSGVAGGAQPAVEGYRLTDPARIIGSGGPKARFARNRAALETYDTVLSESRPPTKEEQDTIAGYIGWGSFGQELFQGSWDRPNPQPSFSKESEWLRDHLGKEGWESIRDSIINAHYTDPPHVEALWRIVEHLGFNGGRTLEPSMGIGSFFGMMPDVIRAKSQLTGIELDRVVGGMAKMLYPDANIRVMGYEKSATSDDFYDLVIGNWPFAKDGPSDSRYNALKLSLHDYFFVKALDQTRPGGLVIGITSSGTMDKKGQTARRQMARRAELVGAFRLPTGAFEGYAGTKVVTDIVILKKRQSPVSDVESEGWINTETRGQGNQTFNANEYWSKNPGRVLGDMKFGTGTTQGRAGMIVERQPDYAEALANIEKVLPAGILSETPASEKKEVFQNRNNGEDQNSVQWNDGEGNTPAGFYIVRGEQLEPLESVFKWELKEATKTEKRRDELKSLLSLREDIRDLFASQQSEGGMDSGTVRAKAKAKYDAFVKKHGFIRKSRMIEALHKAGDPMALTLQNLEKAEGKKIVPRDILLRDIMRRPATDAKGDIGDAYAIQRNGSTTLDVGEVAKLSGKPVADVIKKLVALDQIYQLPNGEWESRDEYLGGNVRRKLREAKDAESQGMDMARNIAALEKIQPKNVDYFEIEVQMGASWIPKEDYLDYASHLLNGQPSDFGLFKGTSGWNFKVENQRIKDSTEATSTWGTGRMPFAKVFGAAMNGTSLKVYDTDSNGVKIFNEKETELVNKKVEDIREELPNWLWSDPARAGRISESYNEIMNSEVVPKRSGSHLRLEGLSLTIGNSEFDFRQHQKDAVWRFIMDGRGLAAHEVGTGKTFTMAGLAVEGKRLGAFRKSLLFAHNSNAESVYEDFKMAYPGGKFLFIDNLSPKNRDNAMRQIAMDDWDAVIVPHSLIDRFALREETLMQIAAKQISQMEAEIFDALEDLGVANVDINNEENVAKVLKFVKDSHTAKELVKARNRIIKRVKDKAAKNQNSNSVFFEDLGVDSIMVDEAHMFKKIDLATRKEVKGLNKVGSERGWMLSALTDLIKFRNNGKGVFLFTGTPLTNNLNEAYNMMKFVMDDVMEDADINGFDDWFNTFAASVTDVELTTGGTYEPVSRLLSFVNVPELARFAGRYFDVVQAKSMPEFVPRDSAEGKSLEAIGRPFKTLRAETGEMSDIQKRHKAIIRNKFNRFQKLDGKAKRKAMLDGVDTPIQLETEGAKAALDYRLVNPDAADHEGSKVNMMLRRAVEHFNEDDKSTQMIFMERGFNDYTDAEVSVKDETGKPLTNNEGKKITQRLRRKQFNLVRDMVDKLVAQGVKPEEIAVFSNMSLDTVASRPGDVLRQVQRVTGTVSKEDLAQQMREGKIRFAIGSTQTMGTGVNAQTHMRAMHHLDAPWTPGELEQRNGRGHRQGNQWNTVFEYRYFVEGSHDARRWQVLLNKVKFISRFTEMLKNAGGDSLRVLTGDGADLNDGGSDVADFEASFATAAGDPRIMVRAKLQTDVNKLERKESTHNQAIARAKTDIRELGQRKARLEKSISEAEALQEAFAKVKEMPFSVETGGKTFTKRADAEEHLKAFPSLTSKDDGKTVLTYNGVRVVHKWKTTLFADDNPSSFSLVIPTATGDQTLSMGNLSIASVDATLRGQSRALDNLREQFGKIDSSVASLEEMSAKKFTRSEELETKRNALQQIEVELSRAPSPAPSWLRNGAPAGSLAYLDDGKGYDIAAHRWDENGYWILLEDGDGMRPVDYSKALDESGNRLFEDVEFIPPANDKDTGEGEISDDTEAFGNLIDQQEGRGLQTSPLPPNLRADSPEWKAMSKEERRAYLERKKGLKTGGLPPVRGDLRRDIISSFPKPPNPDNYETYDERRATILKIARENGDIKIVRPRNADTSAERRFQEATGISILYFKGGDGTAAGFVSRLAPSLIFLSAEQQRFPLSWVIAHELIHAAQKDGAFTSGGIYRMVLKSLTPAERSAAILYLEKAGYKRSDMKSEIPAHIIADAVVSEEAFDLGLFKDKEGIRDSLTEWFDSMPKLNPSGLKPSPDDQLSRLFNSPLPSESQENETADNIDSLRIAGRRRINKPLADEARNQQAMFEVDGKVVGAPRLANPGDTTRSRNEQDVVDALYEHERTVRDDRSVIAEGRHRFEEDPKGLEEKLLNSAFGDKQQKLDDADQVAARLLINARAKKAGNDLSKHEENMVLRMAYRMQRADIARELRIGHDLFKTPEERALEQITDAIYAPTLKTEKAARNPNWSPQKRREFIREAMKARLDKIEKTLRGMGVTLDEITSGQAFLSLSQEKILADTVKTRSAEEQYVIKLIQRKWPLARIRKATGIPEAKIQEINRKLYDELMVKAREKARAGIRLENFRDEKKGLNTSPLYTAELSAEEIEEEARRIVEIGFGISSLVPTQSGVKPRKIKQTPEEKLEKNALTANWARPVFTDGLNSFTFDTKDRSEIMQRTEAIRAIASATGKISTLKGKDQANALVLLKEINQILGKYGTNATDIFASAKPVDDYRFDIRDRAHVAAVARAIRAIDADVVDKGTEFTYSAVLSGIQTMTVNAMAAIPAAWEMSVGRAFEASLNLLLNDPMAATFGEARYMLKAAGPTLARAWSNAVATWGAELPMFDEDFLGKSANIDKQFDGNAPIGGAISGRKGRIIRIPTRLLLATDDFNRTAIAVMEVGAMAYRLARAQGMKPGTPEFDRFLKIQLNTPGSFATKLAAQKASKLIYTNPLPGQTDPVTGEMVEVDGIGDLAGSAALGLSNILNKDPGNLAAKGLQAMTKVFFLPFVRTVFNIMRKGLRHTPNFISMADIAILFAKNSIVVNEATGKASWQWNNLGKNAEIIERASQQIQGVFLMMLLQGFMEGDDDDLTKSLLITGGQPWDASTRAENTTRARAGVGPYRLSFRNKDGTERFGFNYGRIEPFATVLGISTDTMKKFKQWKRSGKDASGLASSLLYGCISSAKEKTFLSGVSDAMDLVAAVSKNNEQSDVAIQRFAASRLAMPVANLIKQPFRESDPYYREKTDNFWEDLAYNMVPYGQKEIKIDPYGEKVEKTGNSVLRIFDVTDAGTNPVNPYDAALLRYDAKHPGKNWFPSDAQGTFTDLRTGEDTKMTPAQLTQFREMAGKRATALMKRKAINLANPTELDIEAMKDAISQGRREMKKILIRNPDWLKK